MLKPIFDNIPDEIKKYRQWVNWRSVPQKAGGKPTKPPFQPNGKLAKIDDPATWSPFSVVAVAAPRFNGVGFVLTRDDEFVALDFDKCRCPAFDGVTLWANSLHVVRPDVAFHIKKLNSYTERSPSGTGIRVFVKGNLLVPGKKKRDVEIYQSSRYVTVTGQVLNGCPRTIESRQAELDTFYQAVFGTPEKPPESENRPRRGNTLLDWSIMREKAFHSVNGAKIERLWNGDYSAYPSQSEADMALCAHLAFWLSGDPVAIDGAFRESGLYRKKWDEKHHSDGCTYGECTIKAVEGNTLKNNSNPMRELDENIRR